MSRLEGPGVDAGVDGRLEAGPLLDAHVDHAGQLWVLERTAVTDDTGPRTVVTRFPPAGRLSERWTPSFGQVFVTAKVESGS